MLTEYLHLMMLKSINRFRFYTAVWMLSVLAMSFSASGQESFVLKDSILPKTFGNERNPERLVAQLIEGKTTDKEKFDMLFSWVVKNIRYDYKKFRSAKGSGKPDIGKILKKKKGICLDYAFLMDSLCKIAGVTNVTVYGYLKDELFDLNDSLYVDNHAWNAVNFNGKWFLYDVTNSWGGYDYDFTRFSKMLIRWMDTLETKVKLKTIIYTRRSSRDCDKQRVKVKDTVSYYGLPFIYGICYFVLDHVPKRVKKTFFQVRDQRYYLTNPEVFAITHFPDNPYWSLIQTKKDIHLFSGDSAYYHLDGSEYINQVKGGRTCIECDDYLTLNELDQFQHFKKRSFAFNKNNAFVTSMCDMGIAEIYYKKAIDETDSLLKMKHIDSCLLYVSNSKIDLKSCLVNAATDAKFQKVKNKTKMTLLLNDNKLHLKAIKELTRVTFVKKRRIIAYYKRTKSIKKSYIGKQKKLMRTDYKPKSGTKPLDPKKIEALKANLSRSVFQIDSLNRLIDTLSQTYSTDLLRLSNNIWSRTNNQRTLYSLFVGSANYRYLYSLDNYKKEIVEMRKTIATEEQSYIIDHTKSIIIHSDTCHAEILRLHKLSKKRNDLSLKTTKLINTLIQEQVIPKDSLAHFMTLNYESMQKDICQLYDNSRKVESVIHGFVTLLKNQRKVNKAIEYENKCERIRYARILTMINRKQHKHSNIARHNLQVVNLLKSDLLKKKAEYLKELKLARKEK